MAMPIDGVSTRRAVSARKHGLVGGGSSAGVGGPEVPAVEVGDHVQTLQRVQADAASR